MNDAFRNSYVYYISYTYENNLGLSIIENATIYTRTSANTIAWTNLVIDYLKRGHDAKMVAILFWQRLEGEELWEKVK